MKPTKRMQMRTFIIMFVVFLCGFGIVSANLFNIQIIKGSYYQELALEQQLRDITINPTRGDILDRNGNVMATSKSVWTVFLSPAEIKDDAQRAQIASGLAEILDVDLETMNEKVNKNNLYEIVAKKVEKDVVEQVLTFASENELGAIHTQEDTKRVYPKGAFAATVLGFVGSDNQGLGGIESYYDKYLTGTPGRLVTARNARNTDMPFEYEKLYDAQDGNTLVLTIDEVIQHYLEKHLEDAVKEHNVSQRGAGIVLNVKTGEILAMATKPDFDPNEPFTVYSEEAKDRLVQLEADGATEEELKQARNLELELQRRNKVISDLYEPGSVFKPITASAALEEGVVTTENTYFCPGYYMVADRMIKCASHAQGGHGQQNFAQIMQNSCNPGFIMTAEYLGQEAFFKYFKAFGLTEKTGIDLPGEASSLYYTDKQMGPVELASTSFGQSNKITPLQMAMAIAAVVNGGNLYQPYVVKQIVDKDGNIVENYEPTLVRQVISEQTSQTIAGIMETVITEGGGKNAYVAGYRLGGKSGTSQKLDSGQTGIYIASFLAFAPVEDPEILVLMFLDEASSYSIYGSQITAPSVGKVMADVLPYLGFEAKYGEGEEGAMVATPQVSGKSLSEAQNDLTKVGLSYNVIGSGDKVVKQYPSLGTSVPSGSRITLYTEDVADEMVNVPNLIGLTPAQVNAAVTNARLNVKLIGGSGSGSVSVAQNYSKDQQVPLGTVITVEFRDSSASDDAV